jgi:hypothetical protein
MLEDVKMIDPPAFMLVTFMVAAPTPPVAIVQFFFTVAGLVGCGVGVVDVVLLEAKSSHVYSPAVMLVSVINVRSAVAVRLANNAVLFLGHV